MTKALIATVVVLAVALAFWFFGMSYKPLDVGASAARPLGDPAKLEKLLVAKGLRKEPANLPEVANLLRGRFEIAEGMTATAYLGQVPGLKHQVVLVTDAGGKILAVLTRFRSGALSYSRTGTPCENFTALYWEALAGAEPKFSKEMEGGADRREFLYAKFARAGADGGWKKEGGSATMMVAQEIADTVTFVAR